MRSKTHIFILGGLVALTSNATARFIPDAPVTATILAREPLALRQATPTPTLSPTLEPPANTISADPWQCVTENITQYFLDVPKPTGDVLSGINSFGDAVASPCRETATGLDFFSCTVSDPKSWCGFTSAAPATVLSSYSAYLSSITSFWKDKSETISALSTSCPVAWGKPDAGQREWLKIAIAHAECYFQAHPATSTPSSSIGSSTSTGSGTRSTTTSGASSSTTSQGVIPRGQPLEGYVLVSTAIVAALAAM